MWKTVLFLLFTLVVVPVIAFYFDDPLNAAQWTVLKVLLLIYGISGALTFILSSITKNYSQVDKLWSVIPLVYVWITAWYSEWEARLVLMAVLVTIWGARLTFNFARRGGYSWKFWEGDEDYRWAELRAKPEFSSPIRWTMFNLFFISGYQMGLILLFTLPAVKAIGGGEIVFWDYLIAGLILMFIVLETIADQQQWNYQTEKYRRIRKSEPLDGIYEKGFTHTGLWGLVRHPNYASEQSVWLSFYFFSVVATGHWINWSAVGALLLVVLFKGSSDFSEEISAKKYPAYPDYQKKVPRFVPWTKF